MKSRQLTKIASISVLLGILATGCSSSQPENNPNADTGDQSSIQAPATPSQTPVAEKPKETPKPITKDEEKFIDNKIVNTPNKDSTPEEQKKALDARKLQEVRPFGVAPSEAVAKYGTAEVIEKSKELNIEQGVHTGLSVYRDLVSTANFYQARDASKDFELINVDKFTDRLGATHIANIEKSIKEKKAMSSIVTMESDGEFKYETNSGEARSFAADGMPMSTVDITRVGINENGNLQIELVNWMKFPTKDHGMVKMRVNQTITLTQTGDGDYLVDGLWWESNADWVKNEK